MRAFVYGRHTLLSNSRQITFGKKLAVRHAEYPILCEKYRMTGMIDTPRSYSSDWFEFPHAPLSADNSTRDS